MRSGETIRLDASSRTHAESLQQAFPDYDSELVKENGSWQVELTLGQEAKLLLSLFETMHGWLLQEKLASMIIHFDDRAFTLLRPTNGDAPEPKEFLLERVAQLQAALESRIVIEQAKGILAGRLQITVEQAFELIRGTARQRGLNVHQFAADIVEHPHSPEAITLNHARPT
jgi:ANTAR domain